MTKVVPTSTKKIVNLLLLLISCYALRTPKFLPRFQSKLSSTTQKTQNDVIEELIKSNDLQNVFTLLLRNPTVYPSPKQSTLLLNNLNILAKMSSGNDISKFYSRLLKGGKAIPSFGVMAADGPLSEVSLPKFEALMTVDPNFLQKVSEMDQVTYDSLRIPNELGVMSSASRSGLETRVKLQVVHNYLLGNIFFTPSLKADYPEHVDGLALRFSRFRMSTGSNCRQSHISRQCGSNIRDCSRYNQRYVFETSMRKLN